MLPGFFYIAGDEPVGGDNLVEPRQLRLVGVAAVAGVLQDLFDLGRRLQVRRDGWVGQLRAHELESDEEDTEDGDEHHERFEAAFRFRCHTLVMLSRSAGASCQRFVKCLSALRDICCKSCYFLQSCFAGSIL